MTCLAVYLAGVVIGLALMRDRWPSRLITALVWPVGPLAFVVVLALLLATATILWPVHVLGATAILGALIWLVT